MQKFMLFVCTLAIAGSTFAQDAKTYKTKFSGANKRVIMDIDAKQLDIEGYNGDEIIIEAADVPSVPKEADGLRPLSAGGVDNTNIGLSAYPNGDVLKINVVMKGKASYKIKMPKELALVVKKRNSCSCNEGGMHIIGMEGPLEINTNYEDITLTDVTGPVVANSNQGKIKVTFDDKMPDKPSSIVNYNGHIDVSVSDKAKILFSILSGNGNMFTDLDLKPYVEPAKIEEKSTKQLQDEVIANAVKDRTRAITINGQSVGKDAGWGSTSSATNAFPNVYYWSGNDWATNNTNIAANSAAPTSYLSWNDADKGFPKYVLNEGQTKILIRTINGNVYLRKKK